MRYNICVSKTHIKNSGNENYHHLINEYTKFDVTLPRTNTIRCPNQNCDSNKNDDGQNNLYGEIDGRYWC